ncbi:hypothetical protein EW146_g1179 [Bondarzewia mesenterica]|uniref:Uncharacterized protein n=1 Tax=Bondarzewia mesenterica TaxID=1095465 RepID=A0A4S4MAW9_9AGAM|nr:hypothetical protein EW146_g1179 [Bondarzewia mesenterica]
MIMILRALEGGKGRTRELHTKDEVYFNDQQLVYIFHLTSLPTRWNTTPDRDEDPASRLPLTLRWTQMNSRPHARYSKITRYTSFPIHLPHPQALCPHPPHPPVPTDFTFPVSRSSLRENSVRGASLAPSSQNSEPEWEEVAASPQTGAPPTLDRSGFGEGIWRAEWVMEDGIQENESLLEEEITRASRWDFISLRRIHSGSFPSTEQSTSFQNTRVFPLKLPPNLRTRTLSAASSSSSPTPHPRIQIPLLSFFASILSIDNDTLHLIAQTPSYSILFAGLPAPPEEGAEQSGEEDPPHGMTKLFFISADEDLFY